MTQEGTLWEKAKAWARRDLPALALASALATAGIFTGIDMFVVLLVWSFAAYYILSRPIVNEEPLEELPVVLPVPDRLEDVGAVLCALDMPSYVLDDQGVILFENSAAIRTFGNLPEGSHISAKFRSPGLLDMVRETTVTAEPNQIEHAERVPAEQVYQVRVAPVNFSLLQPGEPRYFILSFRDISETRRIDRMRSDFVANASHELRTPLASVRGFIETLQGPARHDPKVHERFFGIMLEQVTRMTRLVDDLLSLSRLELKSQVPPQDQVELGPLLGHVRDSLMPLASELGVDMVLQTPSEPVFVTGDHDELIEVFENLMENACKYGQEGKRVEITLTNGAGVPTEVRVQDFGAGIPEEHLPRLTERFYRVSVETSRSKKGTGLGLAIVKHILTRHRARLLVKSELGKGTVFTVRF